MNMKQILKVLVLAIVIAALNVTSVMAANPHFIWASDSVTSSGQLVVAWKEAGLGNNVRVTYEATANSVATWGCINGGGKHPQAANKETVAGPVSATDEFISGKNGQITDSLTFGPIPATPDFSCPPGQKLHLLEVSYDQVELTDVTNGLYVALPDVSRVFFP
jgi:hypothetical protein